jgi:hypothetical protein
MYFLFVVVVRKYRAKCRREYSATTRDQYCRSKTLVQASVVL